MFGVRAALYVTSKGTLYGLEIATRLTTAMIIFIVPFRLGRLYS